MATKENEVFKAIQLALAREYPRDRLFRNNQGQGWCGPGFFLKPGQVYHAMGGERLIMRPSPVTLGLHTGAGDGIGWHDVLITPGMIGHHMAAFLSLETKQGRGKASAAQLNWQQQVNAAGGFAFVLRDPQQLILDIPPGWRF
jgi:hypothetical protein